MAVATPGALRGRAADWSLSEMRAEDLDEVLEIERGSYPTPWSRALFVQELHIPFSRIVVVRPQGGNGGPIVGYLCRWLVADEIHILNVAVHPAHRRAGIGAVLMREALREARERGAETVTLEVRHSNTWARRLYVSFGFEDVGVRRNYYGRGEDALIMRLALLHG
jgi:ribosomal-protein-alanine N-acetyltransferase